MADATENLVRVARAFRRIGLVDAVFVGGATVASYITDPALLAPRVTLDVDVVVDATSRHQFYGIEARLREAGYEPDPDGPIGRWRIEGVPVDLTPAAGEVLGLTNRWYRLLADTALVREIAPALQVRMATPAMFLAAKLEAHRDRGADDPLMSQDLTDIVSLVNGRASLPVERHEDLAGRRVALHGDRSRGRRARRGIAASERACPTSSRRGSATPSRSHNNPSACSTEA